MAGAGLRALILAVAALAFALQLIHAQAQQQSAIGPIPIVITIAGTGNQRSYGGDNVDNVLATTFSFQGPNGVVADRNGNFYVADNNNRVLLVTKSTGKIVTVAGGGSGSGVNVAATSIFLPGVYGVALDAAGNLYISAGNTVFVVIDGTINRYAGSGQYGNSGDNGDATSATLSSPYGIVFDTNSNLYIADQQNHNVRKVSSNGIMTTYAGTGSSGYDGDNVQATLAKLNSPIAVAVDARYFSLL
jgi:sugar lactone lactonase YvrE